MTVVGGVVDHRHVLGFVHAVKHTAFQRAKVERDEIETIPVVGFVVGCACTGARQFDFARQW